METLLSNMRDRTSGSRRALLAVATLVSLGAAVAVGLLAPAFSPYAGGVAGLVLFLVTVVVFHTELSDQTRTKWDLRAAWPIRQRRIVAGGVIGVWAVALLLLSTSAAPPGYVGGTLTVWLVVGMAYFIRASDEERVEAQRAWEEAQAAADQDMDQDLESDYDDEPVYRAPRFPDHVESAPHADPHVGPHDQGRPSGLPEFSGDAKRD